MQAEFSKHINIYIMAKMLVIKMIFNMIKLTLFIVNIETVNRYYTGKISNHPSEPIISLLSLIIFFRIESYSVAVYVLK